jgi:hypothetical protein
MSAKMKMLLSMYATAAISMAGAEKSKRINSGDTEEERNIRLNKAEIERNKANGLKEFFYGENSLWALNKKSADKKAKKLNWI